MLRKNQAKMPKNAPWRHSANPVAVFRTRAARRPAGSADIVLPAQSNVRGTAMLSRRVVAWTILTVGGAMALGGTAAAQDVKTVAVTAIVEHPALDAARDGIKDELAAAGYEQGRNLDFRFESAQGNPATAAQIARKFVGEAPDVIVPISTPSAQAVVGATPISRWCSPRSPIRSALSSWAIWSGRAATSPACPTCRRSALIWT